MCRHVPNWKKIFEKHGVVFKTNVKITKFVTSARLNSQLEALEVSATTETTETSNSSTLKCDFLVYCGQNDADYDAFRAINDAGLVYDGRLVVNGAFKTSDPKLFAAGNVCRFSRRFFQLKLQEHYNQKELAELLASSVLQEVDPFASSSGAKATQEPSSPRISGAVTAAVAAVIPPPDLKMSIVRTAQVLEDNHLVIISNPNLKNTLSLRPALTTTTSKGYMTFQFDELGVLNRLVFFLEKNKLKPRIWRVSFGCMKAF
jgi:hypothetical protein